MTIYIAADHGGFELKKTLLEYLSPSYQVYDCGNTIFDPVDDASDFVDVLARKMAEDQEGLGIVICRSGGAVSIQANRYSHLRATVGRTLDQIKADRNDDHINVLALAADHTSPEMIVPLVKVFLQTSPGDDERYLRRVSKLSVQGTKL